MSTDHPAPRGDRVEEPVAEEERAPDDGLAPFLDGLVTSQADPAVTGEPPEPGSEPTPAGGKVRP